MGMLPKLLYQTYTLSRKIINLSWTLFFYVGSCNSAMSFKLEISITCRVTFSKFDITSPTSTCEHYILVCKATRRTTDTKIVCVGRSKRVSKAALP